jgi:hypothetical protein
LVKQPAQCVARVLAAAAIEELGDRDIGEPKGIIELTLRKQAALRSLQKLKLRHYLRCAT